ncbi:MAG: phosphoenolpyruvate synthase [Candidatus Sungbacteria bacterium RIFCSPHIGHO2_01_FULL_50_25]|uniref:Phosphoenolpyruvate synthase n=1 Tax=Candidatus Sungbacteria bacterium RIFCSPHIGHO2_01_FULL_50_25 TaxID=1802265 RepID=A0A1G2K979_9BACT|nr:MAG: phosphoenolpyruvate synthase [Candidatus Sungbacteria bacterium RIFCSPHIGHO2_01_FULL_50_25]
MEQPFILWFKELGIEDVPRVGGKNAALGEMVQNLAPLGVAVPDGFAITADAYRFFMKESRLDAKIKTILSGLDTRNIKNLQSRGKAVRNAILASALPSRISEEVRTAYRKLGEQYGGIPDVAVRSSATAEDLPGASFAGQQETYLNIVGEHALLEAVKKCIASLFTDRAISYRADKGFSHFDAALSVGIQKMVRSDRAASGVMFTLDTETGFRDVIEISSSYGLGEMIVQGKVTPDEFIVFKPSLAKGCKAIIGRDIGKKDRKIIYAKKGIVEIRVPQPDQERFSLSDEEIILLADWGMKIENHFSKKHGRATPMDIEWAKDGTTKKLFIVQARPETVHSSAKQNVYTEYTLKGTGTILTTGTAVGTKIASGNARLIRDAKYLNEFKKGEVLVTQITDPDWEPIMKIASAIITDKGGRTSHAAIVSRELGIPCVVGTGNATRILKQKMPVTIDCSSGETAKVYRGIIPFDIAEHQLDTMPETKTKIMVNIGSPEDAFKSHYLPAKGVGLGRLEFIIASHIKIHPNALIEYQKLKKSRNPKMKKIVRAIDSITKGYKDKTEFYVDELSEGIAKIAAAFYPHEVIIRFSDFKTNEYSKLIGGALYEPDEENPMLGWRGASRYYDPKFTDAFGLECRALKRVRDAFGLTNTVPMVPFCRTPEEGKRVIEEMEKNGLSRARDASLKIYMMCEIPSNITRADEFLVLFDGMSIGSNDLTQLALGLDRDSGIVTHIANENDPAVKIPIKEIIAKCKAKKKYIGICGQAPSDFPEFAEFLVDQGIDSISLNPDTVVKTLLRIAEEEKRIKKNVS